MNTNYNQRYISTEEKIQKALFSLLAFRDYNDIAIKEICYEAGIHRSSFYAHYQDINHLMMSVEQKLSHSIVKIFDPSTAWTQQTFIKLFEFIKQHKDFYKAYLKTNEQTFMEKNDFLTFINKVPLNNQSLIYSSDEIIYHMAFFAGGLKAMSKSWLMTNCKESPEQMARILTNEYKSHLSQINTNT